MFKKLLVPKLKANFSRKDWFKAMFVVIGMSASTATFAQTTDSTAVVKKDEVAKTSNEKVITGKVASIIDDSPVIGAVVFVKGTNIATETDENGNFTITVPQDQLNGTLVIKSETFATEELPIATTTDFNVSMVEDINELMAVQIIGYGTQEKSDVTGSISTVNSEELNKVVVTDPAQAIQGRATGVTVTQNTGAPGAPLQIRVRGTATINSSDPIYVVNGMFVDNINFLNSNDIESIDILKDASACAVYGSRGANGVILVTTKKGKKKPVTTFSYVTGLSETWKRYNVVEGKDYATLINEANIASGGVAKYNVDTIGTGTDWQDQIFRKAKMNSYHLSTSGSTDRANYYVSGSYLSQEGIVKNSNFERFNFSLNGDYQASKRLKIGSYVNTSLSNRRAIYDGDPSSSVFSNALMRDPLSPVYSKYGNDSIYATSIAGEKHPVSTLNNQRNIEKTLSLVGDWFAEYEIIKGLKAKTNVGLLYQSGGTDVYNAKYYVDPNDRNQTAQLVRYDWDGKRTLWENSLNYEKTFAEKHKVGAFVLMSTQNTRYDVFSSEKQGTNLVDPNMQYFDGADIDSSAIVNGNATENAMLSYLGRVNYEYDNRYIFTANMRRDGSSRFAEDSRWGSFPSVAAGWKISEEKFFEPIKKKVSFLKLRASYGKLGNQNVPGGDYPTTTNIRTTYLTYPFGGSLVNGSAPNGFGNKNLTWEKVTSANIALDFGFFRDKLLFTVDYFTKRTTDMLTPKELPAVAGQLSPPVINYGEVLNKGLELSLHYRNNDHALKYSIKGNLTTIKNEVTKFGDPIYNGEMKEFNTNITQLGHPIAEFYGFKVAGVVQTKEEAQSLKNLQPQVQPGDFKFEDVNKDGKLDDNDRTYLGNPMPKFSYGVTGNLEYKGFDCWITFQGNQGNKIFNGSKYFMDLGSGSYSYSERMMNRWTGEGSTNELPRVTTTDANNNARVSSYYVESGSYLRLKNLQIGYTLPEKFTEKAKLQNIRFFVGGQNLLTFTKYSGLDPEIGLTRGNSNYLNFGIDQGGTYPQARTYQFGLTASF